MDGRGRWMDNRFVERLWRSLKYEDIYLRGYEHGLELCQALETGLVITTITDHTKRWATPRRPRCIALLNHTERNRQVGLEVRPPMVVKKNPPRKREGGSGAAASFLHSQYLGKQSNDGQPNRPSAPKSHSLFSVLSGLKMGTSNAIRRFNSIIVSLPVRRQQIWHGCAK